MDTLRACEYFFSYLAFRCFAHFVFVIKLNTFIFFRTSRIFDAADFCFKCTRAAFRAHREKFKYIVINDLFVFLDIHCIALFDTCDQFFKLYSQPQCGYSGKKSLLRCETYVKYFEAMDHSFGIKIFRMSA